MFGWIKSLFSRKSLSLNDDERQNLTTYSMMGGVMALTVAIGLLVYVLRYSWPEAIVAEHAALLMDFLFKIIMALIALQGVQIIAQATIAIGGRLKAAFGGASIEAEAETAKKTTVTATAFKEEIAYGTSENPL